MSWYCEHCENVFDDLTPAYGWVRDPHCRDCWETLTGKDWKEYPFFVTPPHIPDAAAEAAAAEAAVEVTTE